MNVSPALLVRVLRAPSSVLTFSMVEWDLLVRQARSSFLLGRLYFLFEQNELLQTVPLRVLRHFISAERLSAKQVRAVRREVDCIGKAVRNQAIPVVFLKGAAYVIAHLPAMHGRLFSDVDIVVPRTQIENAERQLILHGWLREPLSPYDQKYYRQWMHELPPLINRATGTVVDVHHNILPDTCRIRPDANKLIADMVPVKNLDNVYVFSPVDMVLHSATHLFWDGEFNRGLRDLVDLDALMRHFDAAAPGFWAAIVPRARELNLSLPLYYALRYTTYFLETPVPAAVITAASASKPMLHHVMDFLFTRALMPDHTSCDDVFTSFARWALYVRSHYLRMPMRLLIPHLLRKWWTARKGE